LQRDKDENGGKREELKFTFGLLQENGTSLDMYTGNSSFTSWKCMGNIN
jgi:hypothetical protein